MADNFSCPKCQSEHFYGTIKGVEFFKSNGNSLFFSSRDTTKPKDIYCSACDYKLSDEEQKQITLDY